MSEKISITKDAMKAEAKIRRIRASQNLAVEKAIQKCAAAEAAFVDSLTHDVRSVLRAANVLAAPESHTTGEWIDIADTVPEEMVEET